MYSAVLNCSFADTDHGMWICDVYKLLNNEHEMWSYHALIYFTTLTELSLQLFSFAFLMLFHSIIIHHFWHRAQRFPVFPTKLSIWFSFQCWQIHFVTAWKENNQNKFSNIISVKTNKILSYGLVRWSVGSIGQVVMRVKWQKIAIWLEFWLMHINYWHRDSRFYLTLWLGTDHDICLPVNLPIDVGTELIVWLTILKV